MIKSNGPILAFAYLIGFFVFSIGGYMVLEGYNFGESFYMVMITITTVGYGEVRPLSEMGRYFTVFLILLSFASLGVVGKIFAEIAVEGIFSGKKQIKKMNKKIDALKDHYILCGFGQVGRAVAEDLVEENLAFVIVNSEPVESDPNIENPYLYHVGDATQEHILEEAGIKRAKGLITMINSDPTNLYIVLTSRELNPSLHIVSRAEDQHSIKRIRQAGADQVISTYASVGQRITDVVLMHSGKGRQFKNRRVAPTPQWNTIVEGSEMVGQTIKALSLGMGKEILGLRQGSHDIIQPNPETILAATDQFLVLDESVVPQKSQINQRSRKVVLVDDNLVTLRLYIRLFERAGFAVFTASDGLAGLKLIKAEKPGLAVIDYQLPKMNGVEICAALSKQPELKDTKFVLFTSNESAEVHRMAVEAGAIAVIQKSPNAFAIIQEILTTKSS